MPVTTRAQPGYGWDSGTQSESLMWVVGIQDPEPPAAREQEGRNGSRLDTWTPALQCGMLAYLLSQMPTFSSIFWGTWCQEAPLFLVLGQGLENCPWGLDPFPGQVRREIFQGMF